MLMFDKRTTDACERVVDRLLREVKGARAVIVTTGDGLQLACRVPAEDDPARLAAVASSLAALGELGSNEAHLGACRHVCIEAEGGHVVLCQAHSDVLDVVVCVAAAGNTEVVRAKMKTMRSLGLDDAIEDILITLGKQYDIIRPMKEHEGIFLYFVLDKTRANLALARRGVQEVERSVQI
jgi:predicted regulator of Ras-like GTPase activity (Roadblock/LC7/MglB family)